MVKSRGLSVQNVWNSINVLEGFRYRPSLSQKEKAQLAELGQNSHQILAIELEVKRNSLAVGRQLIVEIAAALNYLLFNIGFHVTINKTGNQIPVWGGVLAVGGGSVFVALFIVLATTPRIWLAAVALKILLQALPQIDSALQTLPVSKERRTVARKLNVGAKRIRQIGPAFSVGFSRKIVKVCAEEASCELRQLVILVLFDSLDDSRYLKSTAESAVLAIASGRWPEIRKLAVKIGSYSSLTPSRRLRGEAALPIILAVLTAIPAIPVLIHL